jgi:hypothetical protein
MITLLVQVSSRQRPEWVPVFTGLTVRQFDKPVQVVAAGGGGEQTGTGRRWGLSLADRVLPSASHCFASCRTSR